MYVCQYFSIKELVPPAMHQSFSQKGLEGRLWTAFDDRLLRALDGLRRRFGPLTVNTWAAGGNFTESGLRTMDTATGSPLSQHKFGRAADFRSKNVSPEEIYLDLVRSGGLKDGFRFENDSPWCLVHRLEYFPGITWTHIDVSPDFLPSGAVKVFSS